jgi:hypothetical protein
MPEQLDPPDLIFDWGRNLMAKQSFVYLLRLRSVSFGFVATTTDGPVAFDVEDDEGMG